MALNAIQFIIEGMNKQIFTLFLFLFTTFSLVAAPSSVKKIRKQIAERELARSHYLKKLDELDKKSPRKPA